MWVSNFFSALTVTNLKRAPCASRILYITIPKMHHNNVWVNTNTYSMLRDEFRLVVVVVIFIEVYGWKYIIAGQLKKLLQT